MFGEHSQFLEAHPYCPKGVMHVDWKCKIPFESYKEAGGRKGVGVLATVKGRIVVSRRGLVFVVSSVSDMQRLPADDRMTAGSGAASAP